MRKIIFSFLVLINLNAIGQSDSSYFNHSSAHFISSGFMVGYDSSRSAIYQNLESKEIEIIGDTIAVIKFMFDLLREKDSLIEVNEKVIAAAVNYTNHVGQYFKTEKNACGWNKYQANLKKIGYTATKVKYKIPCD